MGRIAPVVAVGHAHRITQRAIARQTVFHADNARKTYLKLMREHARRHRVRTLGYWRMTNHIHLLVLDLAWWQDEVRPVVAELEVRLQRKLIDKREDAKRKMPPQRHANSFCGCKKSPKPGNG